jgi:hypothetical protein
VQLPPRGAHGAGPAGPSSPAGGWPLAYAPAGLCPAWWLPAPAAWPPGGSCAGPWCPLPQRLGPYRSG